MPRLHPVPGWCVAVPPAVVAVLFAFSGLTALLAERPLTLCAPRTAPVPRVPVCHRPLRRPWWHRPPAWASRVPSLRSADAL